MKILKTYYFCTFKVNSTKCQMLTTKTPLPVRPSDIIDPRTENLFPPAHFKQDEFKTKETNKKDTQFPGEDV